MEYLITQIFKVVTVFSLHGLHVALGRPFDQAGYNGAQLAEVLHLCGEDEGVGQHGLAGVDVEAIFHEAGLEDVVVV